MGRRKNDRVLLWGIFLSLAFNLVILVGVFTFLPELSRFFRLVSEMDRAMEPYRTHKQ